MKNRFIKSMKLYLSYYKYDIRHKNIFKEHKIKS